MAMLIEGEERIDATIDVVWAALNDPEILIRAIPGCQRLNKISSTEMTASVQLKMGPVKATFAGHVTLSNLQPPRAYTISGEGKGGIAGFAKGGADVTLEQDGSSTVLIYAAKADVGGKIAQLGSRLIASTAKKLAAEFFAKLNLEVSRQNGSQ